MKPGDQVNFSDLQTGDVFKRRRLSYLKLKNKSVVICLNDFCQRRPHDLWEMYVHEKGCREDYVNEWKSVIYLGRLNAEKIMEILKSNGGNHAR